MHVDVHADVARALESDNQDQIRGLAADARQGDEFLQRGGNPPTVISDEFLAERFDVSRLVPIEANGIDQLFDLPHRKPGERSWRTRPLEQTRRCGMRRRILGARRQQRGNENLEGVLGLAGLGTADGGSASLPHRRRRQWLHRRLGRAHPRNGLATVARDRSDGFSNRHEH